MYRDFCTVPGLITQPYRKISLHSHQVEIMSNREPEIYIYTYLADRLCGLVGSVGSLISHNSIGLHVLLRG
jgi:hypothetical protein